MFCPQARGLFSSETNYARLPFASDQHEIRHSFELIITFSGKRQCDRMNRSIMLKWSIFS